MVTGLMSLFEPDRHEALIETPWGEGVARAAIDVIVTDTRAAYQGVEGLWPIHPLDVSPERGEVLKLLYYGAAGVIWALDALESLGVAPPGPDYADALNTLADRARDDDIRLKGRSVPAFHMGLAGVLMTRAKLGADEDAEADLAAALVANIADPSEGLTWGAAGSLLAASFMLERTGASRWRSIALSLAEAIWSRWDWCETARCHLWTQDLYGEKARQLGALHGFAGNVFALLKVRHLLSPDHQAELLSRVRQTIIVTALHDGPLVNWPFEAGSSGHPGSAALRVQHCMGAPGLVNTLSSIPPDPETDALLVAAGQLVWRAGPLTKLPCLCHGVPGNGFAFLKLFARTGDERWLERARRFAMHAIAQNDRFVADHHQRKFSLWTGDLGLAFYLRACIAGDPAMPTLDVF